MDAPGRRLPAPLFLEESVLPDKALRGTQLRKYQRLPASFPVKFRISGDSVIRSGRACDIGGGGINIESDESIPPNVHIAIDFELRPELKVEAIGRLVWTHYSAANNIYHHRIMFTEIADHLRDEIIAYVFRGWRKALMKN